MHNHIYRDKYEKRGLPHKHHNTTETNKQSGLNNKIKNQILSLVFYRQTAWRHCTFSDVLTDI